MYIYVYIHPHMYIYIYTPREGKQGGRGLLVEGWGGGGRGWRI
jgi:hypothetical protein